MSQDLRPRADKPFYLRIAPLGASITNGYLSSDGNGYRKHLRDQLRFEGWEVNMVGSLNTGTMNESVHFCFSIPPGSKHIGSLLSDYLSI